MKNKLVTFKLDESIREHAIKMKRLYNYPTYDDLFEMFLSFLLITKHHQEMQIFHYTNKFLK